MPRKSLRPHLNQIRAWVRQGRTDAWVAHQLEVSVRDIEQFKRQNELVSDEEVAEGTGARRLPGGDRPARRGRRADRRRARGGRSGGRARASEAATEGDEDEEEADGTRTRRRGTPGRTRADAGGAQHSPARGHLRPRRGGLRAVARPRDPGQPDLRRALGRAPAGRGRRRGGPDRDPPRRRGRLVQGRITRSRRPCCGARPRSRRPRAGSGRRRRRRRRPPPTPTGPREPPSSRSAGTSRFPPR